MENQRVAEVFDAIADILELTGDNVFKIRQYRSMARRIGDMAERLEDMVREGKDLQSIPRVGPSTAAKILEILETGTCKRYEDLQCKVPPGLTELLKIPGLGAKKAGVLHDALQVDSIDGLEKAAKAGKLRDLPGFGGKTEQNILKGLALYRSGQGRFRLDEGRLYAEALVAHLSGVNGLKQIEPAGSLRRRRETIGDVDILAIAEASAELMDRFTSFGDVAEVIAKGGTKSSIRLRNGLQADLRVLPAEDFGAALHYFTGSRAHNIVIRDRAKERGLKVSEYGVFRVKDDVKVGGAREEDVFSAVGLPWIPPELREDNGEIEAAEKGELPKLVELGDIRGDLHMHTTASDGSDSIRAMAEKCKTLGYDYCSITDHTKAVRVAGGLDDRQMLAHFRQIEQVRVEGLRVLKSVEVDILPDGSLDLSDDTLAQADIVVASIHSGFKMDERKMMQRLARAFQNEHVNVFGHPTGRMILEREPYAVNIKELIGLAVDAGVLLEINAHPARLDLRDADARLAKDMGAKLVLNTDAHSADQLDLMCYGVFTARRAWLEKADVANTWPLEKLLKAIRR